MELLVISLVFLGPLAVYVLVVAFRAWIEVRSTPKVDYFTCDKHGSFPLKWAIDMPMDDGGPPHKVCCFCFQDAYKRADSIVREQEQKATIH